MQKFDLLYVTNTRLALRVCVLSTKRFLNSCPLHTHTPSELGSKVPMPRWQKPQVPSYIVHENVEGKNLSEGIGTHVGVLYAWTARTHALYYLFLSRIHFSDYETVRVACVFVVWAGWAHANPTLLLWRFVFFGARWWALRYIWRHSISLCCLYGEPLRPWSNRVFFDVANWRIGF